MAAHPRRHRAIARRSVPIKAGHTSGHGENGAAAESTVGGNERRECPSHRQVAPGEGHRFSSPPTNVSLEHLRPVEVGIEVPNALPSSISPMLLRSTPQPFDRDDYTYELKLDGIRLLSFTEARGRVTLQTRKLNWVHDRFPDVVRELELLPAGTVLDGELVAFRDGRPWFGGIARRLLTTTPSAVERIARVIPATFVPFDLLFLDGECLYDRPLYERRGLLEEAIAGTGLALGEWFPSGSALYAAVLEADLEGIVAKRLDSRYRPGARSASWVKCKRPGYDRDRGHLSRRAKADREGRDQPSSSSTA